MSVTNVRVGTNKDGLPSLQFDYNGIPVSTWAGDTKPQILESGWAFVGAASPYRGTDKRMNVVNADGDPVSMSAGSFTDDPEVIALFREHRDLV